jgi:hypothetical protein
MAKVLISFLIFNLVLPPLWAAEGRLVLRGPSADNLRYKAWLSARPEFQSFSDWWIRSRVDSSAEQNLQRKLELAQAEFLQGSIANAKQAFSDVVSLSRTQDWRAQERTALAYASLRLAQLAKEIEERDHHIGEAAVWGVVDLKSNLFPGPLWNLYRAAIQHYIREQLDLDLWFPGIRFILVDGRPFEALPTTEFAVDRSRHRLTLVFDHAQPVSGEMTWSEFKNWRPQIEPLVKGDCQNHALSEGLPSRFQIYFSDDCIVTPMDPGGTQAPKAQSSPSKDLPLPLLAEASFKPMPGFSPWVWLGVGVLAVGAVTLINQNQRNSGPPPTTFGF